VRIETGFGLTFDQRHLITSADTGKVFPKCAPGQTTGCDPSGDTVVTPGTAEVNPFFAPIVDTPGHRYFVHNPVSLLFSLSAQVFY
jgi:hypothetical protein